MKEVFVLGGTGFLGYYTTLELLKKGYKVSTIALPPMPAERLLPEEVDVQLGNMFEMSDEEILKMLDGKYGFIYAAGADERVVPDAPAIKFFYEQNVPPTQRMARLAKKAGVKKFVLFGSYFSYFAEVWTDLDIRKNPYPYTRLLQESVAYMEGTGGMDVTTLRLPYIFGTMPGRIPLWNMFVDQVKGKDTVYVGEGGTAMVTVAQVAEAAVGAMENGQHMTGYPIGEINMKYTQFNEIIAEVIGQPDTKVVPLPLEQLKPSMVEMDRVEAERGKEHGIHLAVISEIQARDAYLNPEDTKKILGYKSDDVIAAIKETIKKFVLENPYEFK